MSQRTERVDELLRQEIGALLTREIADPRIGFATITQVETTPDLRHAKVWVSVIGGEGDRDETLRALAHAMPFIQHALGKRLRIKRIPALHVRLDDSAERGTRVLHLLQELEAGVDPTEIEPYDESLPTPVKRLPTEIDADDPIAGLGAAAAAMLPPPGTKPARRRTGGPKGVGGPASKTSSRGGHTGGHGGQGSGRGGPKGSRPSSDHRGKR
jgi:ribosome-binding factor A